MPSPTTLNKLKQRRSNKKHTQKIIKKMRKSHGSGVRKKRSAERSPKSDRYRNCSFFNKKEARCAAQGDRCGYNKSTNKCSTRKMKKVKRKMTEE